MAGLRMTEFFPAKTGAGSVISSSFTTEPYVYYGGRQTMEKKQTGSGNPQNRPRRKRKRPVPKPQPQGNAGTVKAAGEKKEDRGQVNSATKRKIDRKRAAVLVIVLVVVLFVLMMLLKGCNGDIRKVHLDMPEFEKSEGFNSFGKEKATKDGVNLAVIPDFTVTEDNQSFVIPYPENEYDAEFYFVDKESGEERYRTKRIKPGTVVKIPAYSFCRDGEHTYRVEVGVFDGDSFEEVPSAVALEMNITKK